jgi:hypothetical protein
MSFPVFILRWCGTVARIVMPVELNEDSQKRAS